MRIHASVRAKCTVMNLSWDAVCDTINIALYCGFETFDRKIMYADT